MGAKINCPPEFKVTEVGWPEMEGATAGFTVTVTAKAADPREFVTESVYCPESAAVKGPLMKWAVVAPAITELFLDH